MAVARRKKNIRRSFFAWFQMVRKYSRVKEYIIHKLCIQKMTAKLVVFREIKSHAVAIKKEHADWRISIGFCAANLLSYHLGVWKQKAQRAAKNRSNFFEVNRMIESRVKRSSLTQWIFERTRLQKIK